MNDENLSSSITAAFENQMQNDKLKIENKNLKIKLGETEEEVGHLKAELEKIKLENKELTEDLEIERKKTSKEYKSSDKMDEAINRLAQVERELSEKEFE